MRKQHKRKYSSGQKKKGRSRIRFRTRMKNFLRRSLRRLAVPFFLLCIFIYLFPDQTQRILDRLESEFPEAGQLSMLLEPKAEVPLVSGNTEVHFLDVGEGLSILVKSDGHAMLYDGGDRDTSSFVVSYLRRQGIETLDYVIASHYDADHLSGLIGALYAFDVGQVLGPDYVHDSDTYQSFLTAVNAQGLTVAHPSVGDIYPLGNASFTVLAPAQAAAEPNNNSIVIRLVNGSTSFLFPGDAEQASENEMCRSGYLLKSDVLCPGHHGSSSSTGYEFLMQVRPEYAVISAGVGNEYGHPHQETLDLLAAAGATVYRTDESGTIVMYSDGSRIVPSP